MTKQATFGSILSSFEAFYPDALAKTASEEPAQGFSETGITQPAKDSEVNEILPNSGNASAGATNKANERGVDTEETLPDAPKGIPTVGQERKLTSPSEKIAADDTDTLVARLRGGLAKIANGENVKIDAEAEASKPADGSAVSNKTTERGVDAEETLPDAPKVAAPVVNLELLAAKTAAFLQQSEIGYQLTQRLLRANETKTAAPINSPLTEAQAQSLVDSRVAELKTAGFNDQQIEEQLRLDGEADAQLMAKQAAIVEDTRIRLAVFVEQKVAALETNGVFSKQQKDILLAELGYPTKTAEGLPPEMGGMPPDEAAGVPEAAGALPPEGGALPPEAAPEAGAPPAGAPPTEGTGDTAQDLQKAIAELQQAVESGAMTEEQALQMLQESGLDVQGMLAAAGGGAPEGGAPAPDAGGLPPEGAGVPPAPEAAPAAAPTEGAAPEGESEPKEDSKKEESEKKEAALNLLLLAADAAFKAGGITKDQAAGMVAALK